MFAITTREGRLLKTFASQNPIELGYHPRFGWISETGAKERTHRRKMNGLFVEPADEMRFRFALAPSAKKDGLEVVARAGCSVSQLDNGQWSLKTEMGEFHLGNQVNAALGWSIPEPKEEDSGLWKKASALALVVILAIILIPQEKAPVIEVMPEPVKVTIIPEKQKAVTVPKADGLQDLMKDAKIADKQMKRAVQQNLGFLGMLGKKDLKGALGGLPTAAKEVTAGAGPGGKEGSGGEYLVGLGQGVKRATVGNSGVAGLGGVGTKGAGGGAGGYGNTTVGSGEGRSLSKIALSQEMVLEGGLDRSVIQATIAKYLSQVRACYEEQLQKSAGLTGQVTMAFAIDGNGAVSSSQVARSSLGNATVENCIATRMRGWQFPKPVGGVTVKVSYPFMLRPMGI